MKKNSENCQSLINQKMAIHNEVDSKLKKILHDCKLDDVLLDFLGSQTFSDVYKFDKILGSGAYGVVIQVLEKSTGKEYALKVKIN